MIPDCTPPETIPAEVLVRLAVSLPAKPCCARGSVVVRNAG